jgi:hypothetical protein
MTYTHRATPVRWQPRSHTKAPMRASLRKQMHGPLVGLDPPPSKAEVIYLKLGIIAGGIAGLGAYYYGS